MPESSHRDAKRLAQNAYEKTFQWIFDDRDAQEKEWSNFRDWLESDLQLYWITGKAGSGKSTLMKFIYHEESSTPMSGPPSLISGSQFEENRNRAERSTIIVGQQSRCEKYLKKWAAGYELVTATYFFWNSGVHMQMSKTGLLRSLLLQILRQRPALIPYVSPSRWEALCLFNDDVREWTKQELEDMLRFAAEKLSQDAKLCLFVDGLDEFDGQHDDLICLFQALIANPSVKVCVLSRPWVLFEDAFKHGPSLTLQNLTHLDIKEPTYANQLVENIVSKASGVFLWVKLVVASLIAGMGHGERVSDLQRRLDLLPPDLEHLYENILQSLDPFYLEHAAQLFKLVQESIDPPPLLLLSFADEADIDSALKQPVQTISPDSMSLRAETMRRRLNSRCKGLLEVGKPVAISKKIGEDTVQYLHRTVKDYIESSEVQRNLQSAIKSAFDPHLKLCIGNLAHLKAIDDNVYLLSTGTFWNLVRRCLYSASRVQPSSHRDVIRLLDELDKTSSILAKKFSRFKYS